MARVTVEDCIEKVRNRFELVMLAAQRARNISAGSETRVKKDNDKNPVIALREIAEDKITPSEIKEGFIKSLQKYSDPEDEDVEEEIDAVLPLEVETKEAPVAEKVAADSEETSIEDPVVEAPSEETSEEKQ